jgi:hypothetical protein
VDVRCSRDRIGARADSADGGSFGDVVAVLDAGRAELEQRDGVAVRRLDRDRPAAAGNRADERDAAGCGRAHGSTDLGGDVDAAVLAARIGVVAEQERAEDRPVSGPRPGTCGRRDGERRQDDRGKQRSPHWETAFGVVEGNSRPR